MLACCAVERDALLRRGDRRNSNESLRSSQQQPQPRTPPSSCTRPASSQGNPSSFHGPGNGRNIGLGLLATDPHLSQQPQPPAEGDRAEAPGNGSFTMLQAPQSDASTASTAAPSGGHPVHKDQAKYASNNLMRSRSSRLLLEAEDSDDEEEDDAATEQTKSRSPLQRRSSALNITDFNSRDRADADDAVPKRRSSLLNLESWTSTVKSKLRSSLGGGGPSAAAAAQATNPPPSWPPSGVSSSPFGKKPADAGDGTTKSASSASTAATATRSARSARSPSKDSQSSSGSGKASRDMRRRNSQFAFAESAQTAIVFDWDDTLFPTSYLIDDLRLSHKKLLKDQKLKKDLYDEVVQGLNELEAAVIKLLKLAHAKGKLILVTLARSPWVQDSCRSFFPNVGDTIKQLGIKVVYAQDGVQVDYNKRKMMNDDEIERFYATMKGKAISNQVDKFYSQYEGQSWKNIISIGDSDFERLGTMMMSHEYMRRHGLLKEDNPNQAIKEVATSQAFSRKSLPIEVNGHVYKVRTKTFKMLDCPTIGELKEEVELLLSWLPKMVALDDGFDADLSALDDPSLLENIEQVLNGPATRRGTH